MFSMTNKMHQTFSAGALPRTPLGISQPHSQMGRGIPLRRGYSLPLPLMPTVSRPESPLLHTSTLTTEQTFNTVDPQPSVRHTLLYDQ